MQKWNTGTHYTIKTGTITVHHEVSNLLPMKLGILSQYRNDPKFSDR